MSKGSYINSTSIRFFYKCENHVCRDSSSAFHLAPYRGKYPAPNTTPDPLEMQKLLAGMADRGADVAVVECESDGLAAGRCTSSTLQLYALPVAEICRAGEVPTVIVLLRDTTDDVVRAVVCST